MFLPALEAETVPSSGLCQRTGTRPMPNSFSRLPSSFAPPPNWLKTKLWKRWRL
jgi:hypothetical protein